MKLLAGGNCRCSGLTTGRLYIFKAGDPTDRYFTNITWSPDRRRLCLNLTMIRMIAVDLMMLLTGAKLKNFIVETDAKYVEAMSSNSSSYHGATMSLSCRVRRDGYNHLYPL